MRHTVFVSSVVMAVSLLTASVAHGAPPSNDDFTSATPVTALPFTDTTDTTESTSSPNDPDCFAGTHTVWYVYTAPTDMRIVVDTAGSQFDTTLAVVTGSPGEFELIGCNDDDGFGLQSRVVFEAQAGQTYYFVAGSCCGEGSVGGPLQLNVNEAGPAPEVDVALIGRGSVDKAGAATFTFSVTCNQPMTVSIFAHLQQFFANRVLIEGDGATDVECSTTATTVQVTVQGASRFSAGKAQLTYSWFACSPSTGECIGDFSTAEVRLRRVG
jgi:hypothetical protein